MAVHQSAGGGASGAARAPARRQSGNWSCHRETGGGFRFDGSHKSRLPTPRTEQEWAFVDRETPPVIERVRSGTGNFPPATSLSRDRVALLDAVLAAYQTRHVLVIGSLPPFSSEVLAQLESDPRHRFFWADFRRAMPELLGERGFPLFDASATASSASTTAP